MGIAASRLPQQQDLISNTEVEFFIGRDSVIRINVDGVCALRVRMNPGSQAKVDDPFEQFDHVRAF